jgi:hypothetical protein
MLADGSDFRYQCFLVHGSLHGGTKTRKKTLTKEFRDENR